MKIEVYLGFKELNKKNEESIISSKLFPDQKIVSKITFSSDFMSSKKLNTCFNIKFNNPYIFTT